MNVELGQTGFLGSGLPEAINAALKSNTEAGLSLYNSYVQTQALLESSQDRLEKAKLNRRLADMNVEAAKKYLQKTTEAGEQFNRMLLIGGGAVVLIAGMIILTKTKAKTKRKK